MNTFRTFEENGREYDDKDSIETIFDDARKELLELSLNNKLLNYRPLKTKGVEIVDEMPQEIYRLLVHEGKSMYFLPKRNDENDISRSQNDLPRYTDEGMDQETEKPYQTNDQYFDDSLRFKDNKLQTPYKSAELQKRLLATYHAANTYIKEQGVNILFLALGMLQWFESEASAIVRNAPIILIPIDLSRSSVRARFKVKFSGDELEENLSLQAKLFSDFHIDYPDLPNIEDLVVDKYFEQVAKSINHLPKWSVDSSRIALGFFSYGKFLMFKDLDSKKWAEAAKPYNHPILHSLLTDGFSEYEPQIDDNANIDEFLAPEMINHVVDADSSQSLAIFDINNGSNLVIQGPPGTGKSQTITNIIAEAIGNGKTVLFVAQKMPALEVVKRRLDAVGLGDACLELHGRKTNKKEVLNELRRSLELGKPFEKVDIDIGVLTENRKRLNQYCDAMNSVIGNSDVTPYNAIGNLLLLRKKLENVYSSINIPIIDENLVEAWSSSDYKKRYASVEELQTLIGKIGLPIEHPFWGCMKSMVLPTDKEKIIQDCLHTQDAILVLQKSTAKLSEVFKLPNPKTQEEISDLIQVVETISNPPDFRGVDVGSNFWVRQEKDINEVLVAGLRWREIHNTYDDMLVVDSWGRDINDIQESLITHGDKWWNFLISDYRRSQSELAEIFVHETPSSLKSRLAILDVLKEEEGIRKVIEDSEPLMSQLIGSRHWKGFSSDWEHLLEIAEWMKNLNKKINNLELPEQVIGFLSSYPNLDVIYDQKVLIEQDLGLYQDAYKRIIQDLELDESLHFGEARSFKEFGFNFQLDKIREWHDQVNRIQEIITLRQLTENLQSLGLEKFTEISTTWVYAKDFLIDIFSFAWYNGLIEKSLKEQPIIASFNGDIHDHAVQKFRELDTNLLHHNRDKLLGSHWKALPKYDARGQLGFLKHEFELKKPRHSIRQLIENAGIVIQRIKPVFMMSPITVAKFLPQETIEFDLVIFDEASQVKPVDAFGAIIRGKQIVVVGDNKQLPPTYFFETSIDPDEYDTESPTINLESILGLCRSKRVPPRMLRWHYRSQHDSLIAISNYEFYNNNLVIFPSPDNSKEELGLFFHHHPDTEYDIRKGRNNIQEARIVAEAVMEHARTYEDLTLGVAAFSWSQSNAIQDQLEILRRQDTTCEQFFQKHLEEPFFIHNLEHVQGDERDVIFISVGYGRTTDGKISLNFGPLNHEGGERRLNVLITRARKRCEIFTNLTADDLDLSRARSLGVRVLKRYLKYAETGKLDLPIPGDKPPDSPFELAVANELRNVGYKVDHQIGTGGFFVDLAIVDEDHPGRYLLGIECDGATYHRAQSARDRDRLRQEVLENKLGWRIYRIWSTDWFQNQQTELNRLINYIEKLKLDSKSNNSFESHEELKEKPPLPPLIRDNSIEVQHKEIFIDEYVFAELDVNELKLYKNNLETVYEGRWANWIQTVVDVEGPIHIDEVIQRIADAASLNRIGKRIYEGFEYGVEYAIKKGKILRRDNFLYSVAINQIKLRSRSSLPDASRKIDLIAPEELSLAVEEVVKGSFGMRKENIPFEASNLLGFSRVSESMKNRFNKLIKKMIRKNRLESKGDYLVVPDYEDSVQ